MEITYALNEVDETAKKILAALNGNILLFYGKMGSGKTTLIKALVKQIGVTDTVSSPTFSLVNEYLTPEGNPVYHFDFYRIKNEEEAWDMGIEEYLYSGYLCLIEWPEKVENLLPLESVKIQIEINQNGTRTLLIRQ